MAKKKQPVEDAKFIQLYQQGKFNYILRYGILSWGLSITIIIRIVMGFVKYRLDLEKVFETLFSIDTVYTLITFSLFGAIWGTIMWEWLGKEVKRIENNKSKKNNNKKYKK